MEALRPMGDQHQESAMCLSNHCMHWQLAVLHMHACVRYTHVHAYASSQYAPRRCAIRVDELDGQALQLIQPRLHTLQHQPFQGNDLLHALVRSAMHEHGMHLSARHALISTAYTAVSACS